MWTSKELTDANDKADEVFSFFLLMLPTLVVTTVYSSRCVLESWLPLPRTPLDVPTLPTRILSHSQSFTLRICIRPPVLSDEQANLSFSFPNLHTYIKVWPQLIDIHGTVPRPNPRLPHSAFHVPVHAHYFLCFDVVGLIRPTPYLKACHPFTHNLFLSPSFPCRSRTGERVAHFSLTPEKVHGCPDYVCGVCLCIFGRTVTQLLSPFPSLLPATPCQSSRPFFTSKSIDFIETFHLSRLPIPLFPFWQSFPP